MVDKHVIAVDLGAESGRVIQASFDGERFELKECHRFPNIPVRAHSTLYWDILRLWQEIQQGIKAVPVEAAALGVDTWGVDFGLLDRDGRLLANPVHYRDKRTDEMMSWVLGQIPPRTIFERTGIQFMQINTLYQLASLIHHNSPLLDIATTLLTIPDLFNYWLTGTRQIEFTFATTTQCYNPRTADWDKETLSALGIPTAMFPPVIQPGTEIGSYQGIRVIAPACHDTGSAVVAVPTTTPNYAYLSSGTWSLLGLEVSQPVINEDAYLANVTNEGGMAGTFRLLKNVMGLWLVQQCLSTWQSQGFPYTYEQLTHLAEEAEPFFAFIDPDERAFLMPDDMPGTITASCAFKEQPIPQTHGQIMRIILESLALKYRFVLDKLIHLTGQPVERLHIIGGGSQNTLLCQMTANACGRMVIAGPVEATALGNAIVQFIALGDLENVAQGRELLSRTLGTRTYEPHNTALWNEQYERFKAIVTSV